MIGVAKVLDKEVRELVAPPFLGIWLIAVPLCFVYVAGTIESSHPEIRVMVQDASDAYPESGLVRELTSEVTRAELVEWKPERSPTVLDLIRERVDIGILWQGAWHIVIRPLSTEQRHRLLEGANAIALSLTSQRPVQIRILQEADEDALNEALAIFTIAQVVDLGATETRADAYLAPRMIALSAAFLPFLLASSSVVRERENGSLGYLVVAPRVGWWNLIWGKLITSLLVGLVNLLILVIAAVGLFALLTGSGGLTILVTQLLAMMSSALLGLTVSVLARSELQAYLVAAVYAFCLIFLTGLLFPLDQSPLLIRLVSVLFSLTFSREPLEQWMLLGLPVWPFQRELFWLSAQVLVTTVTALIALKVCRDRL